MGLIIESSPAVLARALSIAVVLWATLTAAGARGLRPAIGPSPSTPWLSSPPPVGIAGEIGAAYYGSSSTRDTLDLGWVGASIDLTFEGEVVLGAEPWETRDGEDVLLVGTANAADETHIYSFRDLDGDEIIDPESKTLLASTTPFKAYLTHVSFASQQAFFFDLRCSDVWRCSLDVEGLPHRFESRVFASAADHPDLRHCGYVEAQNNAQVLALATTPDVWRWEQDFGTRLLLTDMDADGMADTAIDQTRPWPHVLDADPTAGDRTVVVEALDPGIMEVWRLGLAGLESELLGSSPTGATLAAPRLVEISLSSALRSGETIRVRLRRDASGSDHLVR